MNVKYRQKQQQGMALLVALVMLLVITIIGVSTVRLSKIDTQAAGNSIFSLMVFQGAESALGRAASNNDISAIRLAAQERGIGGGAIQIPDTYFPDETMNAEAKLETSAEMEAINVVSACNLALELPVSCTTNFMILRTTATSRLSATGAKAVHSEGIAIEIK